MSTKEQMLKARDLIKAKRYDEARAILQRINHPTAKEWLAKLDSIAPTASEKGKKAKPRKKAKPKKAKRRGSSIGRLILLLLIIGLIVVVGAVVLLGGDDDEPAAEQAVTDTQDDSQDTPPPDDVSDQGSEGDEGQDDSPPAGQTEIVGSGLRLPFLDGTSALFTAELPQGWVCDCGPAAHRLEAEADPLSPLYAVLANKAFDPDSYIGVPLAEVLQDELRDDETITAQETVQVNGREVLVVEITDEDGDSEHEYYVNDSDGHAVILRIPSYVDAPAALHGAALFIAGNIEGQGQEEAFALFDQVMAQNIAFDAAANRWRVGDLLRLDKEHHLEMPPNWEIAGGALAFPMAVKDGDDTTSATAIVYTQRVFETRPLADIVREIIEGRDEVVVSLESVQSGGREVVIAVEDDPQMGEQVTAYYALDSDGDLIAFITQPSVPDPAALRDDVVFMAGNVETEDVDWIQKLERAGVLSG